MKSLFKLLLLILCHSSLPGKSQDTHFKIDTAAIVRNQKLDKFYQIISLDTFILHNDIKYIPKTIQDQLDQLIRTNKFTIANPGKPWNCCCTTSDSLPKRQLTFLALSRNILAMTYKRGGGIGSSNHLLLINYNEKGITDLWVTLLYGTISNIQDLKYTIKKILSQDPNYDLPFMF